MPPLSPDARVCVTGASGFVASWLVRELLERGLPVRGTARRAAVPHLQSLPGAADRLELVEADLLEPSSFDAAVRGCTTVFHTASPYVIQVDDPQRDLVDPAVNGTLAVLEACAKAPDVKRVVLTSSMAAVTDEPDDARVLTEADWNEKSTLRRNPYYLSKTLAERAAWTFMERERPAFDLVAMNPFVIMGPSLGPGLNVSNKIVADIVNGVYPGILSFSWGIVDVRDVAHAHVRARRPAGRARPLSAGPGGGEHADPRRVAARGRVRARARGCRPARWTTPSATSSSGSTPTCSRPASAATCARTSAGPPATTRPRPGWGSGSRCGRRARRSSTRRATSNATATSSGAAGPADILFAL